MNPRRDFFRQLFVGAAALPVVVKAAIEASEGPPLVDFKSVRFGMPRLWAINPAWENAPYEVHFACSPESFKRLVPHKYSRIPEDQYPYRMDSNHQYISPFLRTA